MIFKDWSFFPTEIFSIKYAALILLILQNTLLIILMRYSRHRNDNITIKTEQHPPPLYAASTAVFMMEIVKFISCNFFVLYEHRGNFINCWKNLQEELSFLEIVRVSIPSFLYTVQNNLLYYALTHLDAATYQVCYQTKILTTAIFSVLMLKKKLSSLQWGSLVLLTVGVSITQYPTGKSPRTDFNQSTSFFGFLAVMAAAVLSGFAGVYFEKILKNSRSSVWMRNIQMGITTIPLAYCGIYFSSDSTQVMTYGFFHGYDSVVVAVILLQAIGGLVVAVVVKYADNILKGFAASFSLVTSLLFCYFLLDDFVPSLTFFTGAFLVNLSMYLYSLPPLAATPLPTVTPGSPTSSTSTLA